MGQAKAIEVGRMDETITGIDGNHVIFKSPAGTHSAAMLPVGTATSLGLKIGDRVVFRTTLEVVEPEPPASPEPEGRKINFREWT